MGQTKIFYFHLFLFEECVFFCIPWDKTSACMMSLTRPSVSELLQIKCDTIQTVAKVGARCRFKWILWDRQVHKHRGCARGFNIVWGSDGVNTSSEANKISVHVRMPGKYNPPAVHQGRSPSAHKICVCFRWKVSVHLYASQTFPSSCFYLFHYPLGPIIFMRCAVYITAHLFLLQVVSTLNRDLSLGSGKHLS